jgi:hypothetical protein
VRRFVAEASETLDEDRDRDDFIRVDVESS